ncbi:hypothetical protein M5689_009336 [Euphorbia peplus]|nr:hypothetical protein M5689_009336 [Euphorbia peplus]
MLLSPLLFSNIALPASFHHPSTSTNRKRKQEEDKKEAPFFHSIENAGSCSSHLLFSLPLVFNNYIAVPDKDT